ncbi:MAG: helix-turn-helix domain-containing protein [Acidimicrobiia bacterium]|nr:helix-turn-helix domain-containing protein [Acidimicrobiia bacterium]
MLLATGIPDLDEELGGLIAGDNVVLVGEDPASPRVFESAFLAEGARGHHGCVYVQTEPPGAKGLPVGPGVDIIDARPGEVLAGAAALERALVEQGRAHPQIYIVVDSLDVLARRWGQERVAAFYERTCARLFDVGALAYWHATSAGLNAATLDRIRQVAQCVLEVGPRQLTIVKAEGRAAAIQGRSLQLECAGGEVRLSRERTLSRLARGLREVRRRHHLSQAELARLCGVTPSAISQAESGARGLSLDTLLLLGEQLHVGLDSLFEHQASPGYVLARRPTQVDSMVPLLEDPDPGLHAYHIPVAPGATGRPPISSKGCELLVVTSGLLQVTVGAETPLMRTGDAVLATRVSVSGWRNLLTEPGLVLWAVQT